MAFAIIISVFMIWFGVPKDETSYISAIIDKHNLLADSMDDRTPRIILIGGSNVAFGIDSHMIEDYSDYDVINMGLSLGAGLKFMLSDVENYIKQDDIVVIIPEFRHFYDMLNGAMSLNQILTYTPREFIDLDYKQWLTIAEHMPRFLRYRIYEGLKSVLNIENNDEIYYRDAFDSNGDLISHLEIESEGFGSTRLFDEKGLVFDVGAIDTMNQFYEVCNRQGIDVCFSYPPIPVSEYEKWNELISEVNQNINAMLSVPIVSDIEDYIFEDERFVDSVYHLDRTGRNERTKRLINDIFNKNHEMIGYDGKTDTID